MHKILLLLLAQSMGAINLSAQLTNVSDIREEMWPANDPHANTTEVPAKWKDASAVVIFQTFHRFYSKKGLNIYNSNALRKRVKIQDNSSLEAYSEFGIGNINADKTSYGKKDDFLVGEIKVIKEDGSSFMINFDKAVDDGEGGKKVAITNLEIGDIIDYYYYQHSSWPQIAGHAFRPVVTTLGEEYPIMKQDLGFTVNKRFYVSFNTYNGAPKVKTTENAADETVTYFIEDSDRDAEEGELWFNPFEELPTIKFQVIQAKTEAVLAMNGGFIRYDHTKLKQTANWDDISDQTSPVFDMMTGRYKLLSKYLDTNCANCNQEERIASAYHYWRFHRHTDTYEKYAYVNAGVDAQLYDDYNTISSDRVFIKEMGSFLKREGIDFDILATIPKRYGSLEKLLLPAELIYVIKVGLPGNKDIYLTEFDAYTSFNEIPFAIQGQEAYVLNENEKYTQTTVIPTSSYNDNLTKGITNVTWDKDDITKVNIDRRTINHGYNKNFDRTDLLTIHDIIREESINLNLDNPRTRLAIHKKKINQFNTWLAERKKEANKEQTEAFETTTESEYEFEIEDYNNPTIVNTGRWNGPFEYTDEFSTNDLIKKAGKNYIFEVGKLMGKQMSIDEDQVDRSYDINMSFARTFYEEIVVELPVGYDVEGLDRLNVSVENKTGKFISTAEVRDGKLYLNTTKEYTESHVDVSDWPLMLAFLEAAYQLSQEKVLLKKSSSSPLAGTR